MANDDLHPLLKSINTSISRLREDVQELFGEVEKIHIAIREAAESIRDAIHESIQAQAELKLMEHVMEVRSVEPQIEAEYDQIRAEKTELEERLSSIGERYDRKHDELDEKAVERVRNLGSHIFEIEEAEFEEGIEEPFVEQVTTTWRTLQTHNDEVREERTDHLKNVTGTTVQEIHDFIDRQATLVEDINAHRLEAETLAEGANRLQVPFYVVEFSTGGVTRRQVVVPSTMTTDEADDWCSVRLDAIPGMDDLFADVPTADASHTDRLSSERVRDALDEYGNGPTFGDSYGAAVERTLPDEVPVEVPEAWSSGGGN
jgi:hypothetical protein